MQSYRVDLWGGGGGAEIPVNRKEKVSYGMYVLVVEDT